MEPSTNFEDKVKSLKVKLVWKLCTEQLNPPLTPLEPLKIYSTDSVDEKAQKRLEYDKLVALHNEERQKREPELLSKFDAIIGRIKASREEKPVDNVEMWSKTSNVTAKLDMPDFVCSICGNTNPANYKTDNRSGDIVCLGMDALGCGNIVQDHHVDTGAQFRNFEGEEDRNHFGPTSDPLLPDSENMRTSISGVGAAFKRLNEAHQRVEMNLSNIDNDDRRTRKGYRTKHKKDAFFLLADIASGLCIHEMIVTRARE
eukprot:gene5903-11915_t